MVQVILPTHKLNKAIKLIDLGDYETAYHILDRLDYKNSKELQTGIKSQYKKALLSNAEVGSYILLGTYEQDNNTENGEEDIEWLVLKKEEDRIFVISKYALDCLQFNTSYSSVTWETCTLRQWLNGTFLSTAFTDEERTIIPSVAVSADKNPSNDTSPGNSTTDQVFLLSIPEVQQYFGSDEDRKCAATAYAVAQGAWTSETNEVDGLATCWWWLRSPGEDSLSAATIYNGGSVGDRGHRVDHDIGTVRPAWEHPKFCVNP